MSRAPPFPTRRRSPSNSSSPTYSTQPTSAPGISNTRPLQISRPPSRPETPSNGSYASGSNVYVAAPNTAPIGPSRPQRSERRNRVSDYSERASTSSQDPGRELQNSARTHQNGTKHSTSSSQSRSTLQRLDSVTSDDGAETTPTSSLASAMSAFQSAGSRRRQLTLDSVDIDYQRERKSEIEAEKARQQRIRERAPGRRVTGNAKAGDIDAVLDQVKDGWEFVIDPDFNKVDLALQLLDQSALGKDMESFRRTKNMLSKALQGSVDKHYQAFAASLPHHASLLNHLGTTQSQISAGRTTLLETKEALGSRRADLVQLWARVQTLEEMINILDEIERLKLVPDMLETLMSEKRLLQASILLVRSLKVINKPDMQEIGGVSDLRSYLNGQETALREILIDELQSHLYLKSFWCEPRWAAYIPNQQTFPTPEFENEISIDDTTSPSSPSFRQTRLTYFLNNLSLRPNDPPHDLSEANHAGHTPTVSIINSMNSAVSKANPEADSFTYMETLLESLAVLGKLGTGLDTIAQRLPGEIFSLVESTLEEIEERAEYGRRQNFFSLNGGSAKIDGPYIYSDADGSSIGACTAKGSLLDASSLRLAALESSAKRGDHEILKDLFWTLYSKLDAVAQGLRVIFEVANRIGSRRDFKDSSGTKPGVLFSLAETWNPVQTEVRTLIQDYLTDDQQGSVTGRNPISSINDVLREGRFIRDRAKIVFRFADTDVKATNKELRPFEDGLTRVLKDTMPGLAPGSSGDAVQNSSLLNATEDRLLGSDQRHKLLLRPDAFHVTVLFQPTLRFLERVADILPSGMEAARASSAVLDDFVLKVYLPQLEEKVLELLHKAVSGPDAFEPDPLSLRLSPQPLMKASTELMALVNSLCAMLMTSPFHRENYTRLILGVVIQFYQRCSDQFQSLTSSKSDSLAEPKVAVAAQWAQRSEIHSCLSELRLTPESDSTKQHQLYRQETNIEFEILGKDTIPSEGLVPSIRNLSALTLLYRSVAWFWEELNALKSRPDEQQSPSTSNNFDPLSGMTTSTPHLPSISIDLLPHQLKLPLSREMGLRFQALLKTFEQLSSLILDCIRIDLRCRTIHYLVAAFYEGNYSLVYDIGEPDPRIAELSSQLIRFDRFALVNLAQQERQYIFSGLAYLMENVLISSARYLRLPNALGIQKVLRDMLTLQQTVKTLVDDQQAVDFEKAKHYFAMFFLQPQEMLESIRTKQLFSFEEYQVMLKLQCGVDPADGSAGAAKAIDRNYSMYVIDLHGLELQSTNLSNGRDTTLG